MQYSDPWKSSCAEATLTFLKQCVLITSVLVMVLRLLRVQHWTSAQPPTATSPQQPCLEWGGGHAGHVSMELLYSVPLAHLRERKGAYCCLRESNTQPTALQEQSLQGPRGIFPVFAPVRPRQHSIDSTYLNFRIRPLDTNQHTCPGKARRLHYGSQTHV